MEMKMSESMDRKSLNLKQFIYVTLITSIWINITEVLRAVFVAFPLMKEFYAGRIEIGPMALNNILVWIGWDMLLTATLVFITWLCLIVFDEQVETLILSATVTTFATLGVFWIGSINSGLGVWKMAFIILPIVWIEMLVGAWIVMKLYKKFQV